MFEAAVFYAFGAVLLASGLAVITARNPVHGVLFLVLVLHRRGAVAAAARRVPRHRAGGGVRGGGDGAVPVRRHDARHQPRAGARRLLAQSPARARGRRRDGVGDDHDPRLPLLRRGAQAVPARLQQHARARPRALHRLRARLPGRRGDPARGDRLRHRPHAAPAQGHPPPGPRPAGESPARGAGAPRLAARGAGAVSLSPNHYLVLGAILFASSVVGIFLNRRNIIVLLMAIELMLLAVNLTFIAFSHYLGDLGGQVFVFFILTVAAAESAIGLAILVVLFRNLNSIDVEDLDSLKG